METTKKYVVVEIGCLECGSDSSIVGVFDDKETANKVAEKCEEMYRWRTGGDNCFEVFELPATNKINEAFKKAYYSVFSIE